VRAGTITNNTNNNSISRYFIIYTPPAQDKVRGNIKEDNTSNTPATATATRLVKLLSLLRLRRNPKKSGNNCFGAVAPYRHPFEF